MLQKPLDPARLKAADFKPLQAGQAVSPLRAGIQANPADIVRLDSRLGLRDKLGRLAVLWGIGRQNYRVTPGLYRLGNPDSQSPVLVTCNYKFTVDTVRHDCAGLDYWLLVLDTRGINVWCAAGKGSFGTAELIRRIEKTALAAYVEHRRLILPQLGAPGVSAPEVLAKSGWRISWGPVRSADIPAFLQAGLKKDAAMSTVCFSWRDRLRVAPMEIRQSWPLPLAALVLAVLAYFLRHYGLPARPLASFAATAGIWLTGSLLFPLLLPILPGKAFALKGILPGLAWGLAASWLFSAGWLYGSALTLASVATVSFLGMNFTGSTTFTSHTGALLEVDKAIIPQAAVMVLALLAAIAGLVLNLRGIII